MKAKFKGEQVHLAGYFDDLIPVPLRMIDKTAFTMHTTEIERQAKTNFKDWKEWEPRRQIVWNYCKRTKVNFDKLIRYASSKYWLQIEHHLRQIGKI
jgi:hypothetical protein